MSNAYPLADELLTPVLRVRMPRAPRLVAPGGTIHVVARCNNREFYFTAADDFPLSPEKLLTISSHAALSRRPSAVKRWTLSSRYS